VSQTYIATALRKSIKERAGYHCEYCLVHEDDSLISHECDHIIAEQHGGETESENLAFACMHCNRKKGANIASIDPETRQLAPLFNQRTHVWHEHFNIHQAEIKPLTPIGRATVYLLGLNDQERVRSRANLVDIGRYP